MSLQTRRLSLDGEELRIGAQHGDGVPLVICSELGANLEMLEPFVEALPEAEILTFDCPGTGLSTQRNMLRRMPGYARLVSDLLDACSHTDPVDLLGVGWGGLLAQQVAHDYPQRVRRLVLVSSSPGHIMFPGRVQDMLRLTTPKRFATARRYTKIARSVYGGRAKHEPALIRENAENVILPSRRGYLSQLLAVVGFSSLPWLHRLQQPTLILAGDDDPIVPLVNARLLNLLIPKSRMQVVQGAGHLLLVTRTEDAVRYISNFLRRRDVRYELPTKDSL